MTVKIDGTNGLLQSYDYQVLTTGFTYTFAAGTQVLVAVPAATLATGTITMPSAPGDGMVITIQSSQQITALTLNGNTGQSIVGTAVQIVPNQPLSWVYRLANTTWYPFAGGAGRASTVVIGTAVASTSGTSIDYTSIPSWVKRITVMLSGVSTNGTSAVTLQIGDSGGIETSGYLGTNGRTGAGTAGANNSTGFLLEDSGASSIVRQGSVVLTLLDPSAYTWTANGAIGRSDSANIYLQGGAKSLSATLDRVRLTTSGGTDTFDAGSVNILFE
jgi:hypothetical protein